MDLLAPGYFQSKYFCAGYWHEDYWQDYGEPERRKFKAQRKALTFSARK
jgi:hypothetical protein